MDDGWWKEWKEAEKQRDELMAFFVSLGNVRGIEVGESTDIVMRHEHDAEMARIESRKEVMLAAMPRIVCGISALVGMCIGFAVGVIW